MSQEGYGIAVGKLLYCVAEPGLPVDAEINGGAFGRRELNRQVLRVAPVSGEELRTSFDLGPLADLTHPNLMRSWYLPVPEPTAVRLLGELTWEVVRLREFPERPSRLDCLFLWEHKEQAQDWFARRTWPGSLYEVEVKELQRIFIANMELVQFSAEGGTVAELMERARRYWNEDGRLSATPEILLEGRTIIRQECLATSG